MVDVVALEVGKAVANPEDLAQVLLQAGDLAFVRSFEQWRVHELALNVSVTGYRTD